MTDWLGRVKWWSLLLFIILFITVSTQIPCFITYYHSSSSFSYISFVSSSFLRYSFVSSNFNICPSYPILFTLILYYYSLCVLIFINLLILSNTSIKKYSLLSKLISFINKMHWFISHLFNSSKYITSLSLNYCISKSTSSSIYYTFNCPSK